MKPVPYPPEIKARGWSFDLDVERIEASDTWALAGNELQPWLLKTWFVAWKSLPVGTLPADPKLFAARIGMTWSQFEAARDVLMRGWWLADDGLLYHDTIAERVQEMMAHREKDRAKAKAWRKAQKHDDQTGDSDQNAHANVTGDARVTHQSHTSESQANPAPTPTPTPKGGDICASPCAQTGFAEFWAAYPRKVDKARAEKAFKALKVDEELLGVMLESLANSATTEAWTKDGGKFIPHAATWLRGRRWEDELEADAPGQHSFLIGGL
jgi:hypothetical protein